MIGAAGVDADGQAQPFSRGIDRPVMALAERHVAHDQHQYLNEALVLRAALDLRHRFLDALHRDHDRTAQAVILVEPPLDQPIVQRAAESSRHILAEHHLHAVERIADAVGRAEPVQRLALQISETGAGFALRRPPVRPCRDRRIHRIGLRDQVGHAARRHLIAPVVVQIRQQAGQMRHGGMQIAIHAARDRRRHVSSLTAHAHGIVRAAPFFSSFLRCIQAGSPSARNSANADLMC